MKRNPRLIMLSRIFLACTLFLSQLPVNDGASRAYEVFQTPPSIIKIPGGSAISEISCSHNVSIFERILWYKQNKHGALKYLGYLNRNFHYPEDDIKEKISFVGDGSKESSLNIATVSDNDSAVYLCAASQHSIAESPQVSTKTQQKDRDQNTCSQPPCLTAGSDVHQPDMLWRDQGDNATIECKHSKGASYYQMYWYRQLPGETMKQIVFTIANSKPDFEAEFRSEKFSVTKTDALSGTFTVSKLVPGDKGLYFCAVSEHSDRNNLKA